MHDLAGQRVVIMGLGRFGGGVGAARFCAGQGADVLVTDLADEQALAGPVEQLTGQPIEFRLGEHNVSDFTTADLIVVNPAVDRRNNRFLRAAEAAGVPLTSEIRLLTERLPRRERTIGVTGTAGKSTTTAMIGEILRAAIDPAGGVHVGGNLGGSLLERLDRIGPDDWVVLELSSFMLEDLAADHWSPHIAVVTNIADNHLDRHGDMANYIAAKQQILRDQDEADFMVLGTSVADWPGAGRRIVVDQPFGGELLVPGEHNRINAAMAQVAAELAGASQQHASEALAAFSGLPHRLQFVTERGGVKYYNDSKSTTPEAAKLAIDAFAPGAVHLLLGGYDKQADMADLAAYAAERCAAVYTLGATGPAIADRVEAQPNACPVHRCGTLERATEQAMANASPGQFVVLSPACASWDQFDHYEQRGLCFARLVRGG